MVREKSDDTALDAFFEAAKTERQEPSNDFLSRLNADAAASLPRAVPVAGRSPEPGIFERLKGWFAVSGLSGAAALGVWIGFVMPEVVTNVAPLTEEVIELSAYLPGADLTVLSE